MPPPIPAAVTAALASLNRIAIETTSRKNFSSTLSIGMPSSGEDTIFLKASKFFWAPLLTRCG